MINRDFNPLARLLAPNEDGARFFGVASGIVTNNEDPDGLGRVKVRFPWLAAEEDAAESHWARIASPMAGADRGAYFLPEVDDEVLVAFEHGRVEFPYILGGLWNGQDAPPESNDDGANNRRTIKSRSGHVVTLDDTGGEEKIEIIDGSGANSIVISTAENTVVINADSDITIESANGKLVLSGNGVEIVSQADVKIEAGGNMDLSASSQTNIEGATVNIN